MNSLPNDFILPKNWKLNTHGGAYKNGEKLLEHKILEILFWKLNHSTPYIASSCAKDCKISVNTAIKYLNTSNILSHIEHQNSKEQEEQEIQFWLDSQIGKFILYMRAEIPDIYLQEMQNAIRDSLHIEISLSAISKLEKKMNLVLRRIITAEPIDRSQFRIRYLRYCYAKTVISNFFRFQLLITDESHFCESDWKRKYAKVMK